MGKKTTAERTRDKVKNWNDENDTGLIDLITAENQAGYVLSGTPTQDAWSRIVDRFRAATNLIRYDKDKLVDRWKTLRRIYRMYRELLLKSGWSWDEERSMLNPGDDSKWEKLKSQPSYYKLKNKSFPLFHAIDALYSGNNACGRYAACHNESSSGSWEPEDTMCIALPFVGDSENPNSIPLSEGTKVSITKRKSIGESSQVTQRQKINELSTVLDKMVDVLVQRNEKILQYFKRQSTVGEAFDKLFSLDIPDEWCVRLGEVLANEAQRVFFMRAEGKLLECWMAKHTRGLED